MDEADLNETSALDLARETELRILSVLSPRPLMSIPHLPSDDSACAFQGYLLAHMAVYQTRANLIRKLGYITDNPQVGPMLAEHYWTPGNSISHDESIRSLTGEGFDARYLADECNFRVVDGNRTLASNDSSDEKMLAEFERVIESGFMDG